MTREATLTVLVVALVVLAGCSGGVPGGDAPGSPTGTTGGGDAPTTAGGTGGSTGVGSAGTVSFYLSDQPNAIADFEHLNVTVTAVGFHRVDADGSEDGGNETDEGEGTNETGDAEETTTVGATTTSGNASDANAATTVANGTADGTETTESDDDSGESEGDGDEAGEEEGEDDESDGDGDDGSGGGKWVTTQVPNVTVDLTRLVGANATRIADFPVPAGSYDAVFIYVSDIDATLASGEQVRVKLPSRKLQLHSRFRVGANQSVAFVYDIAVHEAGGSGKYILQPVVSESGTDVPIEEVGRDDRGDEARGADEKGNDGGDDERQDDERRDDENRTGEGDGADDSSLNVTLLGNVTPGSEATVEVTANGTAVEGATVEVNGEEVGTTDADGRLRFVVPNAGRLEVEVTAGDAEGELEVEFDGTDRGQGGDQGEGGS